MNNKQQIFIDKATAKFGATFDYSQVKYLNDNFPISIICPVHGARKLAPRKHLNFYDTGCDLCDGKHVKRNRITTPEFIVSAVKKHGARYDYSHVNYINNTTPVDIICSIHGSVPQTPDNHLSSNGCYYCGRVAASVKLSLTLNEVIERATVIHKGIYDYSQVVLTKRSDSVYIICPSHGVFKKSVNLHLLGQGCQLCSDNISNTNEFTLRARVVHGLLYDYSLIDYTHSGVNVNIQCNKHGIFPQLPYLHLQGAGCPTCAKEDNIGRYNDDFFISHPEVCSDPARLYLVKIFDIQYQQEFIKIGITTNTVKCRLYNSFNSNRFTINILLDHVDTLYNVYRLEQHIIKNFKTHQLYPYFDFAGRTECFVPVIAADIITQVYTHLPTISNNVYLFDTIYKLTEKIYLTIHSHTRLVQDANKVKTLFTEYRVNNIQLIQIFEDEWIQQHDICMSRIQHILKDTVSTTIFARKCEIAPISARLCNTFLHKYHIQGGDKSSIRYGAFYADELVAVITFGKPRLATGKMVVDDAYELIRFCTNNSYHLPGIASRLLGAFKKYNDEHHICSNIYSFADCRWSLGNLYTTLGFDYMYSTVPNYYYISVGNIKREHRFKYRKSELSKLLCNFDEELSEYINMQNNGYSRIFNAGNLKFEMQL